MSYSPPSIDSSGLTIPSYSDILAWLVGQFQGIYGNATYLGIDSPDYQDIAVRALQAANCVQSLQLLYLAFNPQTAIGSSLDLIGKLIGTPRKSGFASTAIVTLTGTPNTIVTNGIVQDVNGNTWALPSSVTIGVSGTVIVTATAQQAGNITANPGDISIIMTPTAGWTAVTNTDDADPGQAVELDSEYRARLLVAQSKPSKSLTAGTLQAVEEVAGVTRAMVYENPKDFTTGYGYVSTAGTAVTLLSGYPFDSTDAGQSITINGVAYTIASVAGPTSATLGSSAGTQTNVPYAIGDGHTLGPRHSITCVVQGGAGADIAEAIYANHNPGCNMNGTTTHNVTDTNNNGFLIPVSYYVLDYVAIYVSLNVHTLPGYTSATQTEIIAAIVDYLNKLNIGESVVFSEIYGAALTARPNPEQPLFSIRAVLIGYQAASTTANTTSGNPVIAVTSATGIANGQTAVGPGIPANTTVLSIAGNNITLSANPTATQSGVAVQFFTTGTSDIAVAFNKAASGSSARVVVNLV